MTMGMYLSARINPSRSRVPISQRHAALAASGSAILHALCFRMVEIKPPRLLDELVLGRPAVVNTQRMVLSSSRQFQQVPTPLPRLRPRWVRVASQKSRQMAAQYF
jgi:hypothetical protein